MRRTATSWPRAAASAVASARTCSSGERRRRSMPCRIGPNRMPAASSASTPDGRPAASTAQPQGDRSVQSERRAAQAFARRRSRGGTRPRSPGRYRGTTSPSTNGPAAVSRRARLENRPSSATSVTVRPSSERGADRDRPTADRPKQGVHRAGRRGGAGDRRAVVRVRRSPRRRREIRRPAPRGPAETAGLLGARGRDHGQGVAASAAARRYPRQRIAASAPAPASRRSARSAGDRRRPRGRRARARGPSNARGTAALAMRVERGGRPAERLDPDAEAPERLGEPARARRAGQEGRAPRIGVGERARGERRRTPAPTASTSTMPGAERRAQPAGACQGRREVGAPATVVVRARAGRPPKTCA